MWVFGCLGAVNKRYVLNKNFVPHRNMTTSVGDTMYSKAWYCRGHQ